MLDMNMCRICLSSSIAKDVRQLKLDAEGVSKDYKEIFQFCLNLQIEADLEKHTQLCLLCFDKILSFYEFKCLALKSDTYLKTGCLPGTKVKIEIFVDEEIKQDQSNRKESLVESSGVSVKTEVKDEDDPSQDDESDEEALSVLKQQKHNTIGEEGRREQKICVMTKETEPGEDNSNQNSNGAKIKIGNKEVCQDCGKLVKKMRQHRLLHQPITERKRYECEDCSKVFLSDSARLRHHKIKHLGYIEKCDTCNKVVANLRQHVLVMHKNSLLRFACTMCERRFRAQSLLDIHIGTHTNQKLYPSKCDLCEKSFVNKYVLLKHKRQVHEKQKTHACQFCKKCFFEKSTLKLHLRIHTKEKPYECNECGKRCSNTVILKKHLLTHTDDKHFPCDVCDKTFRTIDNLRQHMASHTKERPFECRECGARFRRADQCRRHAAAHAPPGRTTSTVPDESSCS